MAQRYSVVCKLVSKSANNLTPTESGLIAGGDLTPYLNRLEYTNCGIDRQNNAVVSLDVPTDGTFIRTAPILVDKEAKHNYLIDIQITSDGNAGKLFRGMLGQVSSKISATGGQTIDIPLQGIEICMQESYEGFRSRTETPKGRFIDVVTRHKDNGGSDGTIITFTNDNQIDLPDSKAIKQDWKPFGLKTFSDLLGDVIRKLEENPTTGGTLTDYYFDYSPDSSYTRLLLINAEKFGENSTGVTLDPLLISPTGQDDEETLETDNLMYKNHVIVKGSADAGSLPMDHARFQSKYIHGMSRRIYDSSLTYAIGDPVKTLHTTFPQTRFFTAKQAVSTGSGNTPKTNRAQSDANWQEDFTINPAFVVQSQNSTDAAFFSYTPWTNLLNTFKRNMIGANLVSANDVGSGGSSGNIPSSSSAEYSNANAWKGYMVDWNLGRTNYATTIPGEDHFEKVSIKYVTAAKTADSLNLMTEQTTQTWKSAFGMNYGLYDGNRFIVADNDPIDGPLMDYETVKSTGKPTYVASGSDSSNHKNKVIEWDSSSKAYPYIPCWRLSEFPIHTGSGTSAQRDTINNLYDGKVYKFDGTGNSGNWIMAWEANSDNGLKNAGTPFHLVKDMTLTTGATGLPDQAISVEYDWKTAIQVSQYPNWTFGEDENLSSRGAWLNLWFPYPKDTATLADYKQGSDNEICDVKSIGRNYGFDSSYPYLSTNNMSRTHSGKRGWNAGQESEDMGTISGIRFKMRLSLWQNENKTALALGKADLPMVFWAMDKFDRIVWQEFSLRVNGQYQDVSLGFGEGSGMEPYFSRVDEVAKWNGYLMPFDFMLKEREYTGVAFDWRYVKCIGWFYKENYSESGYYNGNSEALMDILGEWWNQFYHSTIDVIARKVQGLPDRTAANFLISAVTLDLDELHFIKDLYVNSDRTTTYSGTSGSVADPRTELVRAEEEIDYENALALGNAKLARRKFFPQQWHVTAQGDARLKLGQRFTVTGNRVPFNDSSPPAQTMNLVVQEVKHTIDSDGYTVHVHGIRKFVLESGDTDQP